MSRINALLLWLLFQALALLPLSWARAIGGFLGRCTWKLQGRDARITRRNLELCLPELTPAERDVLAQQSLAETGKLGLEMIKLWMQPADTSLAYLPRINEHVAELTRLADGRGVIVVAPHLGNWEMLNLFLGRNFRTSVLYQPPKLDALEDIMTRAREKTGSKAYPTNRKGVAAMFNALRRGECAGILPDQEPDRDGGVFAPFFGIDALTMTLVSKLAVKTEAAVVFSYAKRIADSAEFELVFRLAGPEIYSEDIVASVTALNAGVEACVREVPQQYQWEYKRFRQAHSGRSDRYNF